MSDAVAASHVPPAARASYPRRPGNHVRPLLDGGPTFERICAAVESARHSVFATIAFIERDVAMPGGRGTLFDVLDRAAAGGVDVRVLFWREPRLAELDPTAHHFGGDAVDRALLRERGARFRARWDRLAGGFCHHQKSWLVDAGEASEVAFVGGVNPTARSLSGPGYAPRPAGCAHDVYLEIRGPVATDVHHNFAQRWNEASERDRDDGVWPDAAGAGPLALPAFRSPAHGRVPMQITRTVAAGRYHDDTPPPGAKPYPVADGELSGLEQMLSAVTAAERTLYFENQTLASPIVVEELRRALVRGVKVVYLVPGEAHPAFVAARRSGRAERFCDQLAELGSFENFTLAAPCAHRGDGRYEEIYVHAKALVVDDAFAMVGSTNVAERSFRHDTELNAGLWHAGEAAALRHALFANALGRDAAGIAGMEPSAAFDLYREQAMANLDRRTLWEPLEGLVYALDPAQYGA